MCWRGAVSVDGAPRTLRRVRSTLRGGRIQESSEQAAPVVERSRATNMKRILGVPLQRVRVHDVVRVERGAVAELDPCLELARPGQVVAARRATRRELGLRIGAADLVGVQALVD